MPKLSEEVVKQKVFLNSLETCEYISGYETAQSTIKVRCIVHNLTFETKYENVRRDNRKHYICPKCKKEKLVEDSLKVECECAYCHKKFMRSESKIGNSKSGLLFCCREHKDLAQRIESGDKFKKIKPPHYSTGKNYREKAFREYEAKCAVCNWHEDKDVLEVHHIDGDRENNELSNLIILCPICHKKLTTGKYSLIGREKIQKIKN